MANELSSEELEKMATYHQHHGKSKTADALRSYAELRGALSWLAMRGQVATCLGPLGQVGYAKSLGWTPDAGRGGR